MYSQSLNIYKENTYNKGVGVMTRREREKRTNTLYKTEMSTIAGQSCSCICLYEFEWAPCSRVTKLQLEVEGSLVAGGTGGEDGTIVSFRYVEWSPGDG